MADTLIDTLKNQEYAELKTNIEKVVDRKVQNLIQAKKDEIVAKINGTYEEPVEDETTEEVADNTEEANTDDSVDNNEETVDNDESKVNDDMGDESTEEN